jgi:hypothetical protein
MSRHSPADVRGTDAARKRSVHPRGSALKPGGRLRTPRPGVSGRGGRRLGDAGSRREEVHPVRQQLLDPDRDRVVRDPVVPEQRNASVPAAPSGRGPPVSAATPTVARQAAPACSTSSERAAPGEDHEAAEVDVEKADRPVQTPGYPVAAMTPIRDPYTSRGVQMSPVICSRATASSHGGRADDDAPPTTGRRTTSRTTAAGRPTPPGASAATSPRARCSAASTSPSIQAPSAMDYSFSTAPCTGAPSRRAVMSSSWRGPSASSSTSSTSASSRSAHQEGSNQPGLANGPRASRRRNDGPDGHAMGWPGSNHSRTAGRSVAKAASPERPPAPLWRFFPGLRLRGTGRHDKPSLERELAARRRGALRRASGTKQPLAPIHCASFEETRGHLYNRARVYASDGHDTGDRPPIMTLRPADARAALRRSLRKPRGCVRT